VPNKVVGRDGQKDGQLHCLAEAGGSAVDQHVREPFAMTVNTVPAEKRAIPTCNTVLREKRTRR